MEPNQLMMVVHLEESYISPSKEQARNDAEEVFSAERSELLLRQER